MAWHHGFERLECLYGNPIDCNSLFRLSWRFYTRGFETELLQFWTSWLCNKCSPEPNFCLIQVDLRFFPDFKSFILIFRLHSPKFQLFTLSKTKANHFLVNTKCILTFLAVWIFPKIAYARARKHLLCSLCVVAENVLFETSSENWNTLEITTG